MLLKLTSATGAEANLAIAFRVRSRSPAADTPMSLRIWSSTRLSKPMSILLASKASPYWSSPIDCSHVRISLML